MAAELEAIVDPALSQGSQGYGWLNATLLDEPPYGEDKQANPDNIDSAWIRLLQYSGKNCSGLMLELGCPLPPDNVYLGTLQKVEARWLRDKKEQVCRVGFSPRHQQLEAIGKATNSQFTESSQPHAHAANSRWQQREKQLRENFIDFTNGLVVKRLATLEKLILLKIAAANDADIQQELVYLAAARVPRHHLSVQQITKCLRQAPRSGKQPITVFATVLTSAPLKQLTDQPPLEQGYQLTSWLRAQLHLHGDEPFGPVKLLGDESVTLAGIYLESTNVDAIACWVSI